MNNKRQLLKETNSFNGIKFYRLFLLVAVLLLSNIQSGITQGFLHVDGKNIVNGSGENFIIRGIGTGNWMLQEGYMMQTVGVAGTQHEFRAKLTETIGEERTNDFYKRWLENHFSKADVDSMAIWGFNSVRVALHYKWFTPPIEEEPVLGEITWKSEGFQMLDNLLSWCADNQMYLILDLHGAPGGQGKDQAISDYNPTKPSLWESELNKAKTVALWRKFAERYKDEPWIGGYDLINEVNWEFSEGNNAPLRELYGRITDTIREVDSNHLLFIEGNWFANDFTGLTPAWDDNMVYSFHKYWTYNDKNALKWVIDLREQQNRPIWLGETGENSNTWFTNLVSLAERNNIGWSWWPVKKASINNVLSVSVNEDYTKLIDQWRNNQNSNEEEAYNAVMKWADNHKIENCRVMYDVIDALIRQPYSLETKPFKNHKVGEHIFAVDYDLGRNNVAYFDHDTANYSLNTNEFKAWNIGWEYRNDGVDIEKCSDNVITNAYSVGWMSSGEWLQFTLNSETNAAYSFSIRTANENDAFVRILVNNQFVSEKLKIDATGNWDTWKTTIFNGIILPKGEIKVKVLLEEGTMNFNYFSFTNPTNTEDVDFKLLKADTDEFDNRVYLNLNKEITSAIEQISSGDFQVILNNSLATITDFEILTENKKALVLHIEENILAEDRIRISYNGSSILNNTQMLSNFSLMDVDNKMMKFHLIPGKIEAEEYFINEGFELEECSDEGGGYNTSFASNGDLLDYLISVDEGGIYQLNFRVASAYNGSELSILTNEGSQFITRNVLKFDQTGGWQSWQTKSINIELSKGKQTLRILSRNGEYNINWISFDFLSSTSTIHFEKVSDEIKIYPNPVSEHLNIELPMNKEKQVSIFNINGVKVLNKRTNQAQLTIPVGAYSAGLYIIRITGQGLNKSYKVQIL